MLSKCVNCGFYVGQDEEFCPNCGILKPTVAEKDAADDFQNFALFFVVVFFIFAALFRLITGYEMFSVILLSFINSLIVSLAYLFAKEFAEKGKFQHRIGANKDNLKNKENLIGKRVNELKARSGKIDNVLDKINHDDGLQLQKVRQKLLSAREIVVGQFARYELQARKIQLVRLQNALAPSLFGVNRLNEPEMENGLTAIDNAKTEINLIRQNLTRYDAIDFPPKVLPEKESFLDQLDETETSCEKLREVLLSRQATLALRGISPLEETAKLPASKELMHETDVFNIQTTITDISELFDELEREYRRLSSEDEISRLTEI